jgi:hypothetical protein
MINELVKKVDRTAMPRPLEAMWPTCKACEKRWRGRGSWRNARGAKTCQFCKGELPATVKS